MQRVSVLPFDQSDYLHDDEVLAVHREASGTEFRVYVKDAGDPSDQVTLLVPLSELGDMSVGNGYLAIVLSKGQADDRWVNLESTLAQRR